MSCLFVGLLLGGGQGKGAHQLTLVSVDPSLTVGECSSLKRCLPSFHVLRLRARTRSTWRRSCSSRRARAQGEPCGERVVLRIDCWRQQGQGGKQQGQGRGQQGQNATAQQVVQAMQPRARRSAGGVGGGEGVAAHMVLGRVLGVWRTCVWKGTAAAAPATTIGTAPELRASFALYEMHPSIPQCIGGMPMTLLPTACLPPNRCATPPHLCI